MYFTNSTHTSLSSVYFLNKLSNSNIYKSYIKGYLSFTFNLTHSNELCAQVNRLAFLHQRNPSVIFIILIINQPITTLIPKFAN